MNLRGNNQPSALLVDDSAGFRLQLKWLVATEGYCIDEASNCEEAMAAARHGQIDLVIINLHMLFKRGSVISREIRKIPGYEGVLIFALSASGTIAEKEAAHLAGCNSYFNIITDIDLLVRILKMCAEKWKVKHYPVFTQYGPVI